MFSLIEMNYTQGPIHRMNFKGLLKSDASKRVIRPKIAYYAIQNVTSVFDHALERIVELEHTHNLDGGGGDAHRYTHSTDRSLAVFGYRHKATRKQVYTIWQRDNIPADANDLSLQEIAISNGNFDQPVWVDIITGGVYAIPDGQWSRAGDTYRFNNIPVYDAPILIADRSLLSIAQ